MAYLVFDAGGTFTKFALMNEKQIFWSVGNLIHRIIHQEQKKSLLA